MARVFLIISLLTAFAGAAFAQAVITVPIDPPATESDEATDEESVTPPPPQPMADPSTAPDLRLNDEATANAQPQSESTEDEAAEDDLGDVIALPAPPQATEEPRATVAEEALSDEDLMDRFMQPVVTDHIYDAEVDGAENLPAPIPDAEGISRIAVIRGLDKITARVRDIEAPVGVPVMFNSLELLVQTCDKRPPEETPETFAFIQVTEHRLDGMLERIFSGWMYASSPSLNPLEHSTYDIWVIDCRTL